MKDTADGINEAAWEKAMTWEREPTTRVFFRTAGTYGGGEEVTAVFPDHLHNENLYGTTVLTCYAHIGQHGSCNWDWIRDETRPSGRDEYKALAKELESIGYRLSIVDDALEPGR